MAHGFFTTDGQRKELASRCDGDHYDVAIEMGYKDEDDSPTSLALKDGHVRYLDHGDTLWVQVHEKHKLRAVEFIKTTKTNIALYVDVTDDKGYVKQTFRPDLRRWQVFQGLGAPEVK